MDSTKRAYRETEENAKEAWRNRDGEDLADKVGNLGDDIRKELGNLGDDAEETVERHDDHVRRGAIDDPDAAQLDRDRPL